MTTHPPFHAALRALAALFAVLGWLAVVDQANAATPTHVQSRAQEITSGTVNNLAFSAEQHGRQPDRRLRAVEQHLSR